jgi:2-phosphosulfolactate phosphatase
MTQVLNVFALPKLVAPDEFAGGTVVVIDVLRASTTIVYALEAGAKEVLPCLEVRDARSVAADLAREDAVLGGERKGLPIEGFDLGNSPSEYAAYRVGGRTVVFTTTNGTRAMLHCTQAARVLIGAFVNASAVFEALIGAEQVHLLCAGTRGQMSDDDILLAGLLVDRLQSRGGMVYKLNAQALTARERWLASFALPYALGAEPLAPELLATQLRKTPGGRNLVAVGLEDDILAASRIDLFSAVPEMDPATLRIRLA